MIRFAIETDKERPVKIAWNECARGFYCPCCFSGVENKDQKCPYCGQQLLDRYGFDKK